VGWFVSFIWAEIVECWQPGASIKRLVYSSLKGARNLLKVLHRI
jgi:hypothetical protein